MTPLVHHRLYYSIEVDNPLRPFLPAPPYSTLSPGAGDGDPLRHQEDGGDEQEVRAHAERDAVRHGARHLLPAGELPGGRRRPRPRGTVAALPLHPMSPYFTLL